MTAETTTTATPILRKTPLFNQHVANGARIVPFAGYEMPVQYGSGILAEHAWTRESAGLFDISHMGQAHVVAADGRHETVAAALETLMPADVIGLAPGQQRYSQLLNDAGGIIDDLMVTRDGAPGCEGHLLLVLNASRKDADAAAITSRLPAGVRFEASPDLALLALQGPQAAATLASLCPAAADLKFMHAARMQIAGLDAFVSRSGYTGEDGFEISVAAADAEILWAALLGDPAIRLCGLGARDSLRLEAGLCLYGHELDETTSPVEAGLAWSIPKRRRERSGFPGAARITNELNSNVRRLRVGILPDGRAPAREGTKILSAEGDEIGVVTSGGFSPTLKKPIAMGYVAPAFSSVGTRVQLIVRGSAVEASIAKLPFVPHRYRR